MLPNFNGFLASALVVYLNIHAVQGYSPHEGSNVGRVEAGHRRNVPPYAPAYTQCPSNLTIRKSSTGLSPEESTWRHDRSSHLRQSLEEYLHTANIKGLNITGYMERLNSSNWPVIGLSISGGGTQSGMGGLGIWQAFDGRNKAAVRAGTGGLAQILSYFTGLSGGGAITVAALAANNFSTVSQLRKDVNFTVDYTTGSSGNVTQYFTDIFENAGSKAEAGFPVSVADTFGQFWATWLPENMKYANYSDLAQAGTAFAEARAPMPIIALSEVVPGQSPEIGGLTYPGRNATNGFNLTSYELNPFEFGSWAGGRVQAFMPTEYLGTAMVKGRAQNGSMCVTGFDKMSFVQGSTTDAFTAWLIEDFYKKSILARRAKGGSGGSIQMGDIPIPRDQAMNPLVQLVNETTSSFGQTFNDSLWAWYPNPFQDYNRAMANVTDLLLLDGSLAGETDPIRPLIIPERKVDFIIVYEASSEAPDSWVNGTNLNNAAQSASQGNLPFPKIPDVNTMVAQNLTRKPTFFGCNASAETPLVLFLPNSPWTTYSNFTYRKSSFTDRQLDLTLDNAFQLATYGNGSYDKAWPECLACATIVKSMTRMGMEMPERCRRCFDRHCWDGQTSKAKATNADFDLRPLLNPSLSYSEWRREWTS